MRAGAVALLLIFAAVARAQSPADEWRTIETAHFRVHYPAQYEEWASRAASRLESIRSAVSDEVGFVPPQTIDVLVVNPVADANGIAWPLLDAPRMILFAEPPGPDEQIGAYGHWIDLLAVHETAHLVHMLRPSRNPFGRWIERSLLPLDSITLRAPRWVLEGYATVIEGRLTGVGRPTSTVRALVLRRMAESGRLPSYGQLNSDRRFLGMSMAYLMGSAYLEWLELRAGPRSLRDLWARLTARERRSFDEAFIGVFGDRPDRLYGEFTAELTASAVTIRREGVLVEGELFQQTPRASGSPAVSPDGSKIAFVIREREKPEKLVVWSTGAPDEEEKKFAERIAKILERDPEDVAPVRGRPLPRKEVESLVMPDGGDIRSPRWTADGKAIVFSHRAPDKDGFLHFDLYRWDFQSVERITHLADVRDADPAPGGTTAVAVRSRFGASQLVDVDLRSGAVTPRGEASVDVVHTAPRVSPDGRRIAHVAHRNGGWSLHVNARVVPLDGSPSSPAWVTDQELVVSVSSGGFAELVRVRLAGEMMETITRSAGGAFEPAPSPDGQIFFTSLDPDGYVLRVLAAGASPVPPRTAVRDASLVPAIPPEAPIVAPFAEERLAPSRPYGFGRQELFWILGQNFGPGYAATEAGVRLGDVVGRFDAIAIASIGSHDAPEGGAIAGAWRGWPVEVGAHVWSLSESREEEQRDGVELNALWRHRFPKARLTLSGGVSSAEVAFASATLATRQVGYGWRVDESLALEADEGHWRVAAGASFRAGSFRVGVRGQHDGGDGITLGGLRSSVLPRSAYVRSVLDPALPRAIASGEAYDGWRVETTVPGIPFTAFYQRHELDEASIGLAGLVFERAFEPDGILRLPGLDLTAGVAWVFDAPLEGETKFWLGMRWRP